MKNQCRARNRAGVRCRKSAIPGGTVCRMHGGGAPQVMAKAQERLAVLAHPAIDRLEILIDSSDDRIALGAVKTALNCAGLSTPEKKGSGMTLEELVGGSYDSEE